METAFCASILWLKLIDSSKSYITKIRGKLAARFKLEK
jgi:hypothetical protein